MRKVERTAGVATICGLVCWAVLLSPGGARAEDRVGVDSGTVRAERIKELETKAARIRSELESLRRSSVREERVADRMSPSAVSAPEGTTRSAVTREEFTEQPTRHMRESLESLPGMTVRQGNGPRDFDISIRGAGR